ncbi:PI-PLC X domain-containing protein 3-like protein [Leptotrombidium deliense]|uniref:PI-PLC X domain-containing protein 3-like protein n=1 Tax=Leptotrombidium deliense TaxID=299467 RepID=A0A443SSQ2_9ACAR|nr:PI-PLC X domain-containing protein 3-like protein [Leptotrombidium deliense]
MPRYLDVRVAYEEVKGRRSKLWVAHGILRMETTLDNVLQQVKQFLDATENEIIILDFHRFEKGFEESNETVSDEVVARHKQVIKLISRTLRKYLANKTLGYDTKIKDLLEENKRVIVGYAKHHLFDEFFLFPRVKHLWADTDDVQRLEQFFNETLCNQHSLEPQSAMAQLTPTAWGVLFDKYGGTRKMSRKVNSIISRWFRERWWICANIVAIDFVLSNDIIDTSIKANQLRNFAIRKARRTRFWRSTIFEQI